MTIGEKIAVFRKNSGMSQDDLAQKLFVSRQTISQWENDQTTPTIENLVRLCQMFTVTMNDFFDDMGKINCEDSKYDQALKNGFTYTDNELNIALRVIHKRNIKPKIIRMVVYSVGLLIAVFMQSYPATVGFLVLNISNFIQYIMGCAAYRNTCETYKSTIKNNIYWYDEKDEYIEVYKFTKNGILELYEKIRKNEINTLYDSNELCIFTYKYRHYIAKNQNQI